MEIQFMKGNEAIAEAAILCGCRFFFGYPITPQNEIPEYLSRRLPEAGGTFIQAESEIASINMVYGAAGAGARVMTSSSSPGISLKMEGLSYIAGADLPCVIVNIMRAGPGLGGLQPAQGDYFQATRGGGHGDFRSIVYAPTTVQEAADLTQLAFDKADEYRMPAIILGDAIIGQMMEPVVLREKMPIKTDKRWATTGWKDKSRNRAVINSLYMETQELESLILARQERYNKLAENDTIYTQVNADGCDILVVAYGSVGRIARAVIEDFGKKIGAGLFCPLSLYPFPYRELAGLAKGKKAVLCAEMSTGQMIDDVRLAVNGNVPVMFYGRTGGIIPTEEDIYKEILKVKEAM